MAIRIRQTENGYAALCAAKSEPMEGDLYLNDGMHTALTKKFDADFTKMGFMKLAEEYTHEDAIIDNLKNGGYGGIPPRINQTK